MAVVSVTADNVRIAEGNITNDTGTWGNDGGGGGVSDEPDFYYQGGVGALTAQSRKISTSRIGRSYTHGSGTDMTATDRRHYIAKIQITNKDALLTRTAPAAGMKIGSGSGAHYEYELFGNDNYPKRGGWQIIPISPNVTGYRDTTTGSPTLTSVLYWSFLADFSATSKSENVIIDAIDLGAGLCLTGGDGGDTDGVFQDYVDTDEGTGANSWGYVFTEGNAIFATGRLAIGENTSGTAVATGFTDSDAKVEWTNGYVETGFHEFKVNLGSASTIVDLTRCSFDSAGKENNDADRGYTTTEDSRAVFTVTGTSGSLTATNCPISNFASIDLTTGVTFDSCTIIRSGTVTVGGANISGSSILNSAVAADASAVLWNETSDPGVELDDLVISKGTNAHHAIEFGTSAPLTINLSGIDFTGFNTNDGQNDSIFYVRRNSGTVEINLSECTTDTADFSVKTDGATVNVNATVNVTLTGLQDSTEIRIMAAGSNTNELAGTDNATDGVSGNRSFTFSLTSGTTVDIYIVNVLYENVEIEDYTIPSTVTSLPIQQRFDRSYLNP